MSATVVLLHAMGSSHRMWRAQVEALGERYRLVVPDLPGHGATPGPFTFGAAVQQVRELLHDAAGPAYLMGTSLGANVALHTAVAAPELVAGLVPSGAAVRPSRAALAAQRAFTALMPISWTAAMSVSIMGISDPRDKESFAADCRSNGKHVQLDVLDHLARDDLRARLCDISAPALVCCGEADKANLTSARVLAEELPNATLKTIPNGKHLWNLQYPDLCTKIITDFVEEREEKRANNT